MPDRFTFHVCSLPHTRVSREFNACAYTSKIFLFCKMMKARGHKVILYAPEGSDAPCDEHVVTLYTGEQVEFFGVYDWRKEMFKIEWDSNKPYWKLANLRTAAEITKRAKKGDMVCVVGGWCQKALTDLLDHDQVAVCEPFIGYRGVYARFQVYESYTHQAMNASRQMFANTGGKSDDPNGDNYHDVVPVYFDPDEFPEGTGQGGYYAYLGRLICRKGINVAFDTIRNMPGERLLIAGQGVKSWDADTHTLVTEDGQTYQSEQIEYIGFCDVAKRAEFLGNAIAAFCPTAYYEPGGNASVEPQACGTPVLATNYGCFSQQVINGVSGFRPTTLEEWIMCAHACKTLDRKKVRAHAHGRFALDKVAPLFEQYFQRVYNLYMRGGWGAITPEKGDFRWFI